MSYVLYPHRVCSDGIPVFYDCVYGTGPKIEDLRGERIRGNTIIELVLQIIDFFQKSDASIQGIVHSSETMNEILRRGNNLEVMTRDEFGTFANEISRAVVKR